MNFESKHPRTTTGRFDHKVNAESSGALISEAKVLQPWPFDDEPVRTDSIDGITWAVANDWAGQPNFGYVYVPEGHPWRRATSYDDVPATVEGSEITFRGKGWIGFDCLSVSDEPETATASSAGSGSVAEVRAKDLAEQVAAARIPRSLDQPQAGDSTLWGTAESVEPLGAGLARISTQSHGGYKVSTDNNVAIPRALRDTRGWYEEDTEEAIVRLFFTENLCRDGDYLPELQSSALEKVRENFPREYERAVNESYGWQLSILLGRGGEPLDDD